MRPIDAYDNFDRTYSYPVDRKTVIEKMGEIEIEAPHGTNETIGEVLDRVETETFTSTRDLFDVFVGNLSDQYIGRKFYDDRGDNVTRPDSYQ